MPGSFSLESRRQGLTRSRWRRFDEERREASPLLSSETRLGVVITIALPGHRHLRREVRLQELSQVGRQHLRR